MVGGPRLALGTAQWGTPYGIANRSGQPTPEEIRAILGCARHAGLSVLDTARAYGDSEIILGQLAGGDAYWTIVTKLAPDVTVEGASAEEAVARTRQSLEQSRTALRRNRLDAVLLHRAHHREAHGGAIWRELQQQRERNGIAKLGVSAGTPDEALEALNDPSVDVLQVAASLLDRRLEQRGFFERATALGREVHIRSIYLQGVAHLAPHDLPAGLSRLRGPLEMLEARARELGCTVPALFMQYALTLPAAHLVIGCEREHQLAENLELASVAGVARGDLLEIAAAIPPLNDEIVNPARWSICR